MAVAGPPLVLACVAFLVQPRWLDFARVDFPPWLRVLGVPVALAGQIMMI